MPAAGPTHPYYFLAESSAFQASPAAASTALAPAIPLSVEDLQAQSLGLPGEAQLHELLHQLAGSAGAREPSPSEIRSPGFYFLDPLKQGLPDTATGVALDAHPLFDVQAVRRDFPILAERVNGRPLIWLDNAATTQKPQAVIDRLSLLLRARELERPPRRPHARRARDRRLRERARARCARFLKRAFHATRSSSCAARPRASTWSPRAGGGATSAPGDEIVITWLEHHANIVPWQQLCSEKGRALRVAPVDDSGQVILEEYEKLLGRTHQAGRDLPGLQRARHDHAGGAR